MKILVIGSGGREHALAWKLSQSPRVDQIFCAPGNAGTAELGENVEVGVMDFGALVDFAKSREIDLTIVGPDDALAGGIADQFQAAGLKIFGPCAAAARLESSKTYAKDFMRRHGIPTAESREFTESLEAHAWCRTASYPLVVKADGLALGKGVIIATTPWEAAQAVYRCMEARVFGDAGAKIVIEEFLTGVECSLHALVDGSDFLMFPDCRDHKRALDGDLGLNTGGMGTISPSGTIDPVLRQQIQTDVMDRFMEGLRADGLRFQGMLFPGLMLTSQGPKVLEFNCRWGDPETQVLVRRLESDLLPLLEATCDGTLAAQTPTWSESAAVCVILASGGYPGAITKGLAIEGLGAAGAEADVTVFYAGTRAENGQTLTNGGRVLGVTAVGVDLSQARERAYCAADKISFAGLHRRNDIGISCL